jgi:hypothetical protein
VKELNDVPLDPHTLEIMPRCSAAGLGFRIIPAGFNPLRLRDSAASAPLGFESQRLEFLTGLT